MDFSVVLRNSNDRIKDKNKDNKLCNCIYDNWEICGMCDKEYIIDIYHICKAECICQCSCDWKNIICIECWKLIYK